MEARLYNTWTSLSKQYIQRFVFKIFIAAIFVDSKFYSHLCSVCMCILLLLVWPHTTLPLIFALYICLLQCLKRSKTVKYHIPTAWRIAFALFWFLQSASVCLKWEFISPLILRDIFSSYRILSRFVLFCFILLAL